MTYEALRKKLEVMVQDSMWEKEEDGDRREDKESKCSLVFFFCAILSVSLFFSPLKIPDSNAEGQWGD